MLLNCSNKSISIIGLSLSRQCPGLMVTASNEGNLKVWDITSSQPELVAEKALAIGAIQCLSSCPENPFIYSLGGDFKAKNFGVWDITKMETGLEFLTRNILYIF